MPPVELLLVIAGEGIDEGGDGGLDAPADKVKVEHALDGARLHAPDYRLGFVAEEGLARGRVDRVALLDARLSDRCRRGRRARVRSGRAYILTGWQKKVRGREFLSLGVGDWLLAQRHRADRRHMGLRAEDVNGHLKTFADLAHNSANRNDRLINFFFLIYCMFIALRDILTSSLLGSLAQLFSRIS